MDLNLVLVAGRQEAMEELAGKLHNKHQIDTRVVSVDLTSDNFLDSISDATDDLDVGCWFPTPEPTEWGHF